MPSSCVYTVRHGRGGWWKGRRHIDVSAQTTWKDISVQVVCAEAGWNACTLLAMTARVFAQNAVRTSVQQSSLRLSRKNQTITCIAYSYVCIHTCVFTYSNFTHEWKHDYVCWLFACSEVDVRCLDVQVTRKHRAGTASNGCSSGHWPLLLLLPEQAGFFLTIVCFRIFWDVCYLWKEPDRDKLEILKLDSEACSNFTKTRLIPYSCMCVSKKETSARELNCQHREACIFEIISTQIAERGQHRTLFFKQTKLPWHCLLTCKDQWVRMSAVRLKNISCFASLMDIDTTNAVPPATRCRVSATLNIVKALWKRYKRW